MNISNDNKTLAIMGLYAAFLLFYEMSEFSTETCTVKIGIGMMRGWITKWNEMSS